MLFCCPYCSAPLEKKGNSLACSAGHSFDIARQGYVNLLPVNKTHSKTPGDTKEMVDARRKFLELGFYDDFRTELCREAGELLPQGGVILDAGCGEGYYTSELLKLADTAGGKVIGIDISKAAVRAAAGKYKGIDFAVASLFRIPCPDGCADIVSDVFAPIADAEYRRVLKPGGCMIIAVPGARHLYGMKEILYENPYENEEHDTEYDGFEYLGRASVQKTVCVKGSENIMALFSMTPYYRKTDEAGIERLRRQNELNTEIKFDFISYRKL